MDDLLQSAAKRASDYVRSLPERRVAPPAAAIEALHAVDEPLPDTGCADEAVLDFLDRIGTPATLGMSSPRFFGFVIGGALPASLAANWLAGAWDQATGLHNVTPGTSTFERVALGWLLDLFGLPPDCGAGIVTGATVGNFTALAAARHSVLRQAGWDVEADGLFGAPEITVFVSDESHPSVTKALGMLGLGRSRVRALPTDSQGTIRSANLPAISGPTIVCTQVGNVNTGASDPLIDLVDWARPAGAWTHVDGAFGLWAAASPARRHLVAGVEDADSWATDAHKWLNVPYDSGIAISRDAQALRAAMSLTAAYLPTESSERNPSDYTPELSRRARGIEIWAALKSLGRDGVAALVDRCCDHAAHFASALAAGGSEILAEVVLNQVLVSFGSAERTRAVIDAIQKDGTCWCGITEWQGRTAMRISVCNWATTSGDVDLSVAAILKCARGVPRD